MKISNHFSRCNICSVIYQYLPSQITLGPREVIKDVKVSKGETLQLGEGVHRYISNKGGVKCIKKYTIKKERKQESHNRPG